MKGIAWAKGQLAGSKIAEKDLDNKSERISSMPLKFAAYWAVLTRLQLVTGLMELNFQFGKGHSECCVQFQPPVNKPHIHRLKQSSKQQMLRKKKFATTVVKHGKRPEE